MTISSPELPLPEGTGFYGMIGTHLSMRRLFQEIHTAAALPFPVTIQGATGTGKELVVQALHQLSGVRGQLIAVNLAALPEGLAEAELFGSVRGAFTGATDRAGWIELANSGTLYLDEAGEAGPSLQAKLLRVLESGVVHRVGCRRERPVTVRLVTSTQEPAEELVARGCWRADFHYRVSGVVLRVPRLRDRAEDIGALTRHFLAMLGRTAPAEAELSPLLQHSWPGNVRELKRMVERAVCAAAGSPVTARHLVEQLSGITKTNGTAQRSLDGLLTASARRNEIEALVRSCDGDTTRMAETLGLSRSGLYYRLRRLGIPTPQRCRIPVIPGVYSSH